MSRPANTILCIDDDSSVLKLRRMILESEGYRALVAESGRQGLELLRANPVSAVLLDYKMPEMNGAMVAAQAKQEKPEVPIIMVSAYPDLPEEEIKDVDGYMEKGQAPEALLSLLDSMIKAWGHTHPEIAGDYFAFVDLARKYVKVSDGFCNLLGYKRAQLIGKRIEDITDPDITNVDKQFRKYLKDQAMEGEYKLLHRKGRPVRVRYKAFVLPDGCMGAQFEPL